MKARLFVMFLVFGLALIPVWSATAAPPQPDDAAGRIPSGEAAIPGRPPQSPSFAERGGPETQAADPEQFLRRPFFPAGEPAEAAGISAVPLGQPGVVYRYVQTWGDPKVPYFDDTAHLNEPVGLGADGDNIWIAEDGGRRLMEYASDGTFLMQIGKAGLRHALPATVQGFTDVAVDSSGNIWATDWANHLLQFNSSGQYVKQLFGDWNGGQGNTQFNGSYGLAFDSTGRLYVSDTYNHRIQVFQPDGTFLATIGATGQSGTDHFEFNEPRHIAIDSSNHLYVADAGNHRVQIFDVTSFPTTVGWLDTIGETGQSGTDDGHFSYPNGVAVDEARNRIYVADKWNGRVQVFSLDAHTYQATLEEGDLPSDVAVDAAGNLYVGREGDYDHTVRQYDSSLNYQRSYGQSAEPYVTDTQHYFHPLGVAVAMDGSMYITESNGKRLTKLGPTGATQWTVGEPGVWHGDDAGFAWAAGVDLDSSGRVYVADAGNNRVQVFAPNGIHLARLGTTWDDCGAGNNQFCNPRGVAIGPGDMLYVADSDNHRVQVFDSALNYVATIGQPGVSGSDEAHFNWPIDVDVDDAGNIYVVDHNNHRVQVFNSSRVYVRTIGESGVAGDDYGHLRNPTAVVIGAGGRTFVTSSWGDRIQVYDGAGAYLTTIGGSYGERTGQLRDANGLALDSAGNLYVAESENHRVQKYAPGVPGWKQVNINGFGDRNNRVSALAAFGSALYAGTVRFVSHGAQLWRMDASGAWTPVMTDGFGVGYNSGIDDLVEFNGSLYAGVWNSSPNPPYTDTGGEIWRSSNGTDWEQVMSGGYGDRYNGEVMRLGVFENQIYAGTWSYTTSHGAEIWRSATGDGGDWEQVAANGIGDDPNNSAILTMEEFGSALYAGTYSWGGSGPIGGEVWRYNGNAWTRVADGFGSDNNYAVSALRAFGSYLYAGIGNLDSTRTTSSGGKIYRCSQASGCDEDSDWVQVIGDGFGKPQDNPIVYSLMAFDNRLYAVTFNSRTGMEVWRTADGTDWEQVGFAGLGDSNNTGPYWDNGMAVFNNHFYIGTYNSANGGEIWQKTVTADFSAIPRQGHAPMNVNFTDESAGDVSTREWDFGDGSAGSMLANPTHEYVEPGLYTVSLTVGDGVDEDTATKAAHIDTRRRVYLPLVGRNFGDPYLYDDFNNTAYDGSYDPAKWTFDGENMQMFQARVP